ncbi:RNA recognition motif domain-containing protein [Kamptonema formosum]|uniref:RNA recognition motif domain-containing protein n=1 Tax=Kamptonema formosum TaxID=331992 RepID=UPI00034ACE8F|nr:RNA-binding protein [Oscillatoria sp. PCC 10802]
MSIYVGNLSYEVTPDDLTSVFAEYGTVKRVNLPTDRETGRPRGFGFVEMSTDAEEQAAIDALDGAEWMGRDLRVNKAKPREDRPPGGGSRGGGSRGGGGGYGGGGKGRPR